jgi:hypothetical protein
MLDEFRTLGGTADNVRLGTGALGRGLFPIEPGRTFRLHVPENLLISTADIVFENGALKVGPDAKAGPRERKFVEGYYADLAWGGGGRAEIESVFEQMRALPAELRRKLATQYHCGSRFEDATSKTIETLFIDSREFAYKDRDVLMPLLDLANHGNGCRYGSESGISIAGIAEDEITACYSETDTYGLFQSWGFVCESMAAFSIEFEGPIGAARLYIERKTDDATDGNRPWVPDLTRSGGAIKLSFLMLGNRSRPGLCREIFRRILCEVGFDDADEAFDKVHRANLQHFLALLADLEPLEGPMIQTLRRMARLQLQTLTHCIGSHEI